MTAMDQHAARFADAYWALKQNTDAERLVLAERICALSDALRDLLPYAKTCVPNPINVGEENVIAKAERLLGVDLKECDVCGQMKSDVTLIHVYHAGDTSACEDCRGAQP